MRKYLILTAMTFAALEFVGCSRNDVLDKLSTANKVIEFGTYVGRDAQTRASEVKLGDVETSGFGVYAYYTQNIKFAELETTPTPNFMKNQQVTYNGTSWVYAPVKYWPNNEGDYVSFFAYAPFDPNAGVPVISDGSAAGSKKVTIDFIVANDDDQQKDLLWNNKNGIGESIDVNKQNISTGVVTFNFAHALSRIGFSVQGAVDQLDAGGEIASGTKITVNEVILSGEAHKYEKGVVTKPAAGAFYESGTLNLNSATADWSNTQGEQKFTLDSNDLEAVVLSGSQKDAKRLNKEDSYLMVIPQNFAQDQLYVYVEYTVTTEDSNLEGEKSEITNYISKSIPINFEAGKAYTLNLVLGMTSVKVVANVDGWEIQPSVDVDLPENKA